MKSLSGTRFSRIARRRSVRLLEKGFTRVLQQDFGAQGDKDLD